MRDGINRRQHMPTTIDGCQLRLKTIELLIREIEAYSANESSTEYDDKVSGLEALERERQDILRYIWKLKQKPERIN